MEKSKETKFELRDVDSLIPYARNARTHSAEQVNRIAGSIKEFGFMNPVIVSEDGGILAGHGRVMAAQKLGLKQVPCIVESHLSETQKKAYILADNKLALDAGWDEEMLKVELNELREDEFDLDMIGFSNDELEQFLAMDNDDAMPEESGEEEETEIEVEEEEAITKPGDVWILGEHRLVCGDSTDAEVVGKVMGDRKPNLMVTDPPYGVNYDPKTRVRHSNPNARGEVFNDDRDSWEGAYKLFPGNVAYVWHAGNHADVFITDLKKCGFEIINQIIWNKNNFAISWGDYKWKHEPCIYATRGGHNWQSDTVQTTVWDIPMVNALRKEEGAWGHGTQKPLECMRRPIENNSAKGEWVYDPFSGSGTTLIACEKTGRKCIAVELSPNYCDAIVRRWQAETGRDAELEGKSVTFNELLESRKG
jgi:DNA modification methylase